MENGILENPINEPTRTRLKRQGVLLIPLLVIVLALVAFFVVDPTENRFFKKTSVKLLPYSTDNPNVVRSRVNSLSKIAESDRVAIQDSFFDTDLRKAREATGSGATLDFKRSEPYRNLYSRLRAHYNVTSDPQIKSEMVELEKFIETNWPDVYKSLKSGGAFLE